MHFLFLIFSFTLFVSQAQAQSHHGLAMHGTPKYNADFTHFDYANPHAPKGGTIRQAVQGGFDSFHPFILKGTPPKGLTGLDGDLLYASLTVHAADEPFTQYGYLAESIEMPEDRTWIAFNIHPQAVWHDGQPITAHDVVWTHAQLIKHGRPFYRAYFGAVKDIKATSDTRVYFDLGDGSNRELPLILGQLQILPEHYWEGREFNASTLEAPVGSGPYQITDFEANRTITYTRIKDWWAADLPVVKGRYNFDNVVYDYYKDANVILEAFLSGDVDVREENTAKLWATAYDVEAVRDGRIQKISIPHNRPAGMQGFVYNTRRTMFSDPKVREALAYAFDFEWSNKQFAYGAYTRTASYFENSDLAAKGAYTPPKTDGSGNIRVNLRKAMQLLDQAGYALNEDGVRVHIESGTRLEFEIVDNQPAFERWTLPFIQNLKKIGVIANFRLIDHAQYIKRLQNFDFDMTVQSFPQSLSPGNEQNDFWSSAKADIPGSRNIIGVRDTQVDALIKDIISAHSREDLVRTTQALDRQLLAGHYVIPQWHLNEWRVAHWNKFARPKNQAPYALGITDTWWIKP